MQLTHEITAAISAGKDEKGNDRTVYQRVGSIFETSKEGIQSISLTHTLADSANALLIRSNDKEAEFNDEPNKVVGEVSSVIEMSGKSVYTKIGVVLSTQNNKVRVLKLNLVPVNAEGILIQPPRSAADSEPVAEAKAS